MTDSTPTSGTARALPVRFSELRGPLHSLPTFAGEISLAQAEVTELHQSSSGEFGIVFEPEEGGAIRCGDEAFERVVVWFYNVGKVTSGGSRWDGDWSSVSGVEAAPRAGSDKVDVVVTLESGDELEFSSTHAVARAHSGRHAD